jgi:hypothetical protein
MKYGAAAFGMWLLQFVDSVNDVLSVIAVTLSILVSIVGLYKQLKKR